MVLVVFLNLFTRLESLRGCKATMAGIAKRETRKPRIKMKNNQQDKREIEINKQREELNKLLEIDPQILREIHGGAGCDCCKWEAAVA